MSPEDVLDGTDAVLDVTIFGNCCSTYTAAHQASALEALQFYRFAQVESWPGAAGGPRPAPE